MPRKLYLLLVTLLASGLIAVGCGDDDDDDGGGSDEPAQTQEDTGGDTGGGGTGDVSDEQIEQAVEQCKQAVDAYPQLSDNVKGELEQICEDATDAAAEGDEDALRDAQRDVCVKVVEDQLPAGNARDTALESCETAGQ